MSFRLQVTGTTFGKSVYPIYDAADVGFRGYWYPVMWSRSLHKKPVRKLVCGEEIAFVRQGSEIFAVHDRCPHRGIPLSQGRREFPGTISCVYHGWTFDLRTGALKGVLSDGPDSPLTRSGHVCVRTYPVQELVGLIWVYVGDGEEPPPLSEHVPQELLAPGMSVVGRIVERPGDWRQAVENGYDEGHAKYLHRTSIWTLFRYLPAWSTVENITDGPWLTRRATSIGWRSEYPGLGHWPAPKPWWTFDKGAFGRKVRIGVRMPGLLKVEYIGHWWTHYEWYVPTELGHHRYFQITLCTRPSPVLRQLLWVWYWVYLKWMFHHGLFHQDDWMIREMRTPPEVLYRPDISIVGWRRLCEEAERERSRQRSASGETAGHAVASPPGSCGSDMRREGGGRS